MIKKLTLGIAIAMAFSSYALAQNPIKHCDVSVEITAPQSNAVLPYGDSFHLSFNYTNHGPDALVTGDTLFFLAGGSLVLYSKLLVDLPVNGTIMMNDAALFYNPTTDSLATDICVLHLKQSDVMYNAGGSPATTYIDDDTTNDMSCVPVVLLGTTDSSIGIHTVHAVTENLVLYPNPAKDHVNFYFTNSNNAGSLKISLTDMMGRVVATEVLDASKLLTQKQYVLNISSLEPGMYFIDIEANGKRARGKFTVAK
jgi:hypothetical protein